MTAWVHIVGGGVAGLSLTSELAQRGELPGAVVISDPRFGDEPPQSQTFCFWCTHEERLKLKPDQVWGEWSFSMGDEQLLHRGEQLFYAMIKGETFRERALNIARRHPQITLRNERLEEPPKARHVFDARPPPYSAMRVKQSFAGLEVKLNTPHRLTGVELMHELCCEDRGLEFRYVLPLSPQTLLVEYTRFSSEDSDLDRLESRCSEWLTERFGSFLVERKEKAHIPMGLKGQLTHWGMPIGARAGMARDATGYAFLEIQAWAHRAASELTARNRCTLYNPPRMRAWMDHQLLTLIEQRPEIMPEVLMNLARALSPDAFARFMTSCSLNDALRMMLSAPKRPFMLTSLGQVHRI